MTCIANKFENINKSYTNLIYWRYKVTSMTLESCSFCFRFWFLLSMQLFERVLEFHGQLKTIPCYSQLMRMAKNMLPCHTTQNRKMSGRHWHSKRKMNVHNSRLLWKNDKIPQAFSIQNRSKSTSLFNHCSKPALSSHQNESICFSYVLVKQYRSSRFMGIFKVALGVCFALKSWKEYLLLFSYLITLDFR